MDMSESESHSVMSVSLRPHGYTVHGILHARILECVSSVQSHSRVRLFATPWIAVCQASLPITNSWSSLRLMSMESVMPSSLLILCHPLLLLSPVPPSIRVFSNESTLRMRWPKYWSFSFSIIPSKEHPGMISFRMDWLDLLAVQLFPSPRDLPNPGVKPGLLHHRQILYQLSHWVSPRILGWVDYFFSGGSSWPRNQTGVSCISGRFFTSWATVGP